ncbi:TPA: hypothetical protein VCA72_001983 [Streptococcus suis]|nr:hypothetical protein [Streptococcus suis]
MNKQEVIEQLEWNVVRTTDFDRAEDVVVFEKVKSVISQIHEPPHRIRNQTGFRVGLAVG